MLAVVQEHERTVLRLHPGSSRKYGTLYTGVTGDLPVRIYIHREDLIPGFSSRYHVHKLVNFEQHDDPCNAITREKQIKNGCERGRSD